MGTLPEIAQRQEATGSESGRIEELSLSEIAVRCKQEIDVFRRVGKSDERFALEVFRRAVLYKEKEARDDAWALIFHLFSPLVVSWLNHIPQARMLEEHKASLLNAIFAKVFFLFQRNPEKIVRFTELRALLGYFKKVTHSSVTDEIRSLIPHLPVYDLAEIGEILVEDDHINVLAREEHARIVWRVLEEETFDNELLYLRLTFVQGMKPSEIAASYPEVFSSVMDVYRARQVVFRRLARNVHIAHLRDSQRQLQMVV